MIGGEEAITGAYIQNPQARYLHTFFFFVTGTVVWKVRGGRVTSVIALRYFSRIQYITPSSSSSQSEILDYSDYSDDPRKPSPAADAYADPRMYDDVAC